MRRVGLLSFIVLALLAPANAVAATPQFNGPFPIPSSNAKPTGITPGPDGALWFAEHDVHKVGRIANGTVSESATLPGGATQPNGIAAGPDGKLWLTTRGDNGAIVDLTLAGPFEGPFSFTAPISSDPVEIVIGPGGAPWFTDKQNDMIGKIAPDGTIAPFAITDGSKPYGIVAGPDGNLWYTLQGDKGRIGRMTPAGETISFQTPTQDSNPTGIVAGADGALWFTEQSKDRIGRITTGGQITEFRVTGGHPTAITLGADGNLWFVQPDAIGRITPGGTADSWPTPKTPAPASKPVGIATGSDGNLWFTDDGRNAIGQITAGPAVDALAPVDLAQSTATLRGAVRPAAQATTYYFEYGPTASFGATTPAANAGNGTAPVDAAASVRGLAPGATYHYRLVATNGTDTTLGADRTFTTPSGSLVDPIDPPALAQRLVEAAPAPVLGRTIVAGAAQGVVKVRLKGTSTFVPLTDKVSIPTGSELDTAKGTVTLVSALDTRGHSQTGLFSGGRFEARQTKTGRGMTDLYLRGPKPGRCTAPNRASASARSKKRKRSLWGKDSHGRFRTHGADSVATVRGTRWLTEDRCDGTLTRVTQGSVVVKDLRAKRKQVVRAGQSYLARRR